MSIIGSNILAGAAGSGVSAYEIEQSLRFNQYVTHLARTPSSAGNVKKWTWSGWVKRGKGGIAGQGGDYHPASIVAYSGSTYNLPVFFGYNTEADQALFYYGNTPLQSKTTQVFRDFSGWYHFVAHLDTDQATAANRQKLYVNGVEVTAWATQNLPSQGDSSGKINTTSTHRIGWTGVTGQQYFDGYMAECHFVDGQALDPTDFGEFDESGVWRPKRYTGTYGTNGFYLKFDPTATNGIGHDHSGNGNHFTPSGFTTSGTGTDVMSDTPTNNYATLNPVDNASGATLANGNLETTSGAASYKSNFGTMFASSGKWYAEFTVLAGSNDSRMIPGVGTKQTSVTTNLGNDTYSYSINYDSGTSTIYKRTNNATTALTSTGNLTTNSVVMIALDLDNNKLWFGQDGTWFDSGAPASGTNQIFSIAAGEYTFMPCTYSDGKFAINFGQRAFAYTPPTGFKALNTSNLPAPDIADGSEYFNTVLYTGNGSTQSITGVGFQPDWIWCKTRNSNSKNTLTDAVRGADRQLWSDLTTAEQTNSTDFITSFDSDGFTSGPSSSGTGSTNENNGSFVAWNWLAGNGTSSNTDGTITSTVSANQTAGFSIVSYSGNNNSSATVGHGLGVSPDLVIVKDRSTSNYVWMVKFAILGGNILELNGSGTANAPSSYSTGTIGTLTNTTFGFTTGGSLQAVNNTGQNYIAYCFAEVEGYSKFGSYVGNNSSDGPFVYCGFKPRWIMRKATGDTSNWVILDTARDTYNETDNQLLPNTSGTESDGSDIDILSNGFKMRSAALNGSTTYIFAAFASHPFGGSGVSPATAR